MLFLVSFHITSSPADCRAWKCSFWNILLFCTLTRCSYAELYWVQNSRPHPHVEICKLSWDLECLFLQNSCSTACRFQTRAIRPFHLHLSIPLILLSYDESKIIKQRKKSHSNKVNWENRRYKSANRIKISYFRRYAKEWGVVQLR